MRASTLICVAGTRTNSHAAAAHTPRHARHQCCTHRKTHSWRGELTSRHTHHHIQYTTHHKPHDKIPRRKGEVIFFPFKFCLVSPTTHIPPHYHGKDTAQTTQHTPCTHHTIQQRGGELASRHTRITTTPYTPKCTLHTAHHAHTTQYNGGGAN